MKKLMNEANNKIEVLAEKDDDDDNDRPIALKMEKKAMYTTV